MELKINYVYKIIHDDYASISVCRMFSNNYYTMDDIKIIKGSIPKESGWLIFKDTNLKAKEICDYNQLELYPEYLI